MAKNTGYKITIYIDVNPKSPTYRTTRTERTRDTNTCGLQDENWQLVGEHCELNEQGTNSGYKITVYQNVNRLSPTYGTTREERTQDTTTCPMASAEPNWIEDDKFESYCETIYYEPSHTLGNTGNKVVRYYDANPISPTYMSGVVSSITSSDCPAPNTEPQLESITESCQICSTSSGLQYSGYKEIVGIDKNVYSSTFMNTITTYELDTTKCPASIGYTFDIEPMIITTSTPQSGTAQVSVTSNRSTPCGGEVESVAWSVSESCSWVTITKNANNFVINYSQNTSTSQRECQITVTQSGSGESKIVTLYQAGQAEQCVVDRVTVGNDVSLIYDEEGIDNQVSVLSHGSCAREWEVYRCIQTDRGTWVPSPTPYATGSGIAQDVHFTTAGHYRLISVDDRTKTHDFWIKNVYQLCVSGNTNTPNAWEIQGTTSSSEQICDLSPLEFGIACTATTSDTGHLSRTLFYRFSGATIQSIGPWRLTDGINTCSGASASLNQTIQCSTDCYATFGSSSATLENNTQDRWVVGTTFILDSGDTIEFRGTLYGAPMMGLTSTNTEEETENE